MKTIAHTMQNTSEATAGKKRDPHVARLQKELAQLKRENQQLKHAAQSHAQQEQDNQKLFSIISHDLRSPLSSMVELTRFVVEHSEEFSREELINNFKNFESSFDRIYRLVDNMLYWSSIHLQQNNIAAEYCSLKELVEENIQIVEQRLKDKSLSLNIDINDSDFFYADHNMINLVFRNLLYNSIKFTPQGGHIHIYAESTSSKVALFVKDNGIGISTDNQNKILNPKTKFTTTGTEGESGTGLGLNLCNEMIQRNKGSFGFHSAENQGSCFYFTLPVSDGEQAGNKTNPPRRDIQNFAP